MDLSERQIKMLQALRAVLNAGTSATPKAIAEQFEPGSDPRGVGQTFRRLPDHVTKQDDGTYKLTVKGAGAVRRAQ